MRTDIVVIIIAMAVVTFLTRFGAQLAFRRTGIPAWLSRWLKHVPTGILTALIVPALVLPRGSLDLTWHNPYLLAGLVAAAVARRSGSAPLTMGVGMATILLLRFHT
ncbi:AzlD domain-containing protein [Anaeroselena agilis]|uniref:AzlD domain-containing protein n=1 Tax=Anaeroselena agilis TaxID=3063788 RepID=A0ABU3P2E1_9FIRM|nr:AzlD domain-containing protein [Selenomonadales bacterium 4137-cl]